MVAAALLCGCVTHAADTDLFGRHPARDPAPPPARTVSDGTPDDLLAGIVLRPLPTGAAASATPVVAAARSVAAQRYVVQPGDTLRGVGNRTGAGAEAIALANALAPPYALRAGQTLAIPAGRYHEILAGQTGIAIARAYGVRWADLVAANRLTEPAVLRIGQRLRLPGDAPAAPAPAPTLEQRAAAFHLDIDDIVTGSQPAGAPAAPPARASGTRFAWPLTGRLLQRFGPAAGGRINSGVKIATPLGTPVHASAGGTIRYAGTEVPLLGGLVLIDHGDGWVSLYGHLDRVAVRTGDRVAAGAIIATSGESGQAREPELHFELRHNRVPVDPVAVLPTL